MYALVGGNWNDCIMDSLMNRAIYGDDKNKWEPSKHRVEVDDKNFIEIEEEDEEEISIEEQGKLAKEIWDSLMIDEKIKVLEKAGFELN